MKYKIGDKVRIVDKWPRDGSACQNNLGEMDKWLGKVMTIREVGPLYYLMEEDQKDRGNLGWAWNEACIAGLVPKFKAGDRVLIVTKSGSPSHCFRVGDELEVVGGHPKMDDVLKCRRFSGHCQQWVCECDLAPAVNKIVVTTDGKTTTAKLFNGKDLVKSAEAKCSRRDTFDFEVGAALAVDRLLGRTEVVAEAPKFTKDDLKTGMFGRLSDGRWFVVLEDKILYGQQDGDAHSGGYDSVRSFDEDLTFPLTRDRLDFVVNACSFRNAKAQAKNGEFVWKRPGVKI